MMAKQLGQLGARFFAYAQMRKLSAVRTGDLVTPLRISAKQEHELLDRLSRSGLITQVRRGLYLVPPRLPLGGKWNPDEILAINTLMDDQQGRYQITGPRAFNLYGFDEQIPATICIYNNRLSGLRRIGATTLELVRVDDGRLGSTEKMPSADGLAAVYSSRVRTLVDAVYDWSRFATLPRAYEWIHRDLSEKRIDARELVNVTLRYGNQGTVKRMGALLERIGAADSLLRRLQKAIRTPASLIPLVPGRSRQGQISRRWGIILND